MRILRKNQVPDSSRSHLSLLYQFPGSNALQTYMYRSLSCSSTDCERVYVHCSTTGRTRGWDSRKQTARMWALAASHVLPQMGESSSWVFTVCFVWLCQAVSYRRMRTSVRTRTHAHARARTRTRTRARARAHAHAHAHAHARARTVTECTVVKYGAGTICLASTDGSLLGGMLLSFCAE